MKACFIKPPYDINMIWESMRYPGEDAFFSAFGMRSIGLCLGIEFQADTWIMDWVGQDPAMFQPYVMRTNPEMLSVIRGKHKNVVQEDDIPWDEYDFVYSHYPMVSPKTICSYPKVLWTYRELAHRHRRAKEASRSGVPYGAYDLYLDHHLSVGVRFLERVPAVVGFPYLHNLDVLRRLVRPSYEPIVFIGPRVLSVDAASQERQREEYQTGCGLPVKILPIRSQVFSVEFPAGRLLASREYLQELGKCKYFLTWRGGNKVHVTGLAVVEAAALGLITIANSNSKHNQKVCHPMCLIPPGSPARLGLRLVRKIERHPDLQKEILHHQDAVLRREYWNEPIALLHRAVEMKRA